jgi:hypothetical protein
MLSIKFIKTIFTKENNITVRCTLFSNLIPGAFYNWVKRIGHRAKRYTNKTSTRCTKGRRFVTGISHLAILNALGPQIRISPYSSQDWNEGEYFYFSLLNTDIC